MNCYAYILFSKILNKFYIGHTCDNLDNRLYKHNANHKGFTGKANDREIVYFETFLDRKTAYARERQIKKWKSRKKIMELIKNSAG